MKFIDFNLHAAFRDVDSEPTALCKAVSAYFETAKKNEAVTTAFRFLKEHNV
jgi:hypothetical protein